MSLPESPVPAESRERTSSTRRTFLAAGSVAAGGLALAACGGASGGSGTQDSDLPGIGNNGKVGGGRSGEGADHLFIAGFQFSPPTNFNTFAGAPAWPAANNVAQYVYETLLRFDVLSGEVLPGLAADYQVDGTSTVTLTMQQGTKWSDGTDLTTDDVLYTFELGKIDPAVTVAAFWVEVDAITADGDTITIAINQDRKNVGMVLQQLAVQFILPKAVFEPVAAETGNTLASWESTELLGSGPYTLELADQTQIVLARNDDYWGKDFYGGLPAPKKIIHPIFKSNEDSNLKFQNGELDVMQAFVPQISKMWDAGKPVGTYLQQEPFFIPGSMPLLFMNTARGALADPQVRRAIAHAIDYPSIAETAMSGYSGDVQASLIIPGGAEDQYTDSARAAADGWSFDAAAAEKVLTDAGYAKGSDGIYAKGGEKLGPWKVITPQGWTDWNAALEIVAKNLQAIGIDVSTNFPQQAQVTTAVANGDFDLACWYVSGTNPATPWQRFSDVMSNVELAPAGQTAYRNYGRWTNDQVNDLLEAAAAAADDGARKQALTALDDLYRAEAPAVPLMYRPDEFFEFNASNWSNFPTEENDYAPPMFRGAGNQWLFKIQKIAG